jgi:acetyl-CoA decarbonylase/synthase, CODH/ACS complex subunit delta
MAVKIPAQAYTGAIRPVTFEKGAKKVTVGGETAYPFYSFEGEAPYRPKIAIQVLDCIPDDWPEACLAPYRDVLEDPVAWARKAQDSYHADMIFLWLKSTDPNGSNRSAEEAAETAKQVLEAIDIPLIVWGSASVEKDAEVLRQVAMACAGERICLGPVQEANHKQIGAQALAYNHMVAACSPIDINLAKQLNILLGNLGIAEHNLIIDPTSGPLGYGMEYTYSVMERVRQAALTQQDDKLQFPLICNFADDVWKCKEARVADDPNLGDAGTRGVMLEAITATTYVLAGADVLVMRHPHAIQLVRNYLADMAGDPRTETTPIPPENAVVAAPAVVSAANVPAGMRIDLEVANILGGPLVVDADRLLAVVRISEEAEGGITVSEEAVEAFSAFLRLKKAALERSAGQAEADVEGKPAPKKIKEPSPEKPLAQWSVPADRVGEVEYPSEKKKDFSGKEVELVGPGYVQGVPEEKADWREKLRERQDMIQYLKTGMRYWYSSDAYGSEKRKTPA